MITKIKSWNPLTFSRNWVRFGNECLNWNWIRTEVTSLENEFLFLKYGRWILDGYFWVNMDNFRGTSKRSELLSRNFEFSNSCILEVSNIFDFGLFDWTFFDFWVLKILRIFRWTFRNSWEVTMGWILCDGRREEEIILSGIFDWLWSWESFKNILAKNSKIFTIFFFSNLLKSHFSLIKFIWN